jgi:hypothetical protein
MVDDHWRPTFIETMADLVVFGAIFCARNLSNHVFGLSRQCRRLRLQSSSATTTTAPTTITATAITAATITATAVMPPVAISVAMAVIPITMAGTIVIAGTIAVAIPIGMVDNWRGRIRNAG